MGATWKEGSQGGKCKVKFKDLKQKEATALGSSGKN